MPIGEPQTADAIAAAMAEAQAAIAGYNAPPPPAAPRDPASAPPATDMLPVPTSDVSFTEHGEIMLSAALTASAIPTLKEFGLGDADAATLQAAIAKGVPMTVTQDVVGVAKARKAQVLRDPEWCRRWLAGGVEENKLMTSINLRLCAQIRK